MARAQGKRLARLAAGALLLLVADGFASPRSAWAGCDHQAGSQSHPLLDLYRLDMILVAGSSSTPYDGVSQSPRETPARRKPLLRHELLEPRPFAGFDGFARDRWLPAMGGSSRRDRQSRRHIIHGPDVRRASPITQAGEHLHFPSSSRLNRHFSSIDRLTSPLFRRRRHRA